MIHSKLRQTNDWKLCHQVMEVFLEVVAPELILKAWEGFNQQSHLEKGHAKGKDREAEYWCWGFQHEEWIAWLYLKGYSRNHCGWPDRASRSSTTIAITTPPLPTDVNSKVAQAGSVQCTKWSSSPASPCVHKNTHTHTHTHTHTMTAAERKQVQGFTDAGQGRQHSRPDLKPLMCQQFSLMGVWQWMS